MIWFVTLAVLLVGDILLGVSPSTEYSIRGCGAVTFSESDTLGILFFGTTCDTGTVFVTSMREEVIRFQCFDREGEE
jgi:hypothetical protein